MPLNLRNTNSPYGDTNKGSVLSWNELDQNFIFLKGEDVLTASTNTTILTLTKRNGDTIDVDLNSLIDSTDNYTTGGTLVGDVVYFDRSDQLSAYTVNLSAITGNLPYEYSTVGGFVTDSNIEPRLYDNTIDGPIIGYSTIAGGSGNTITGGLVLAGKTLKGNFIGSGVNNYIYRSFNGSIVGGYNNYISSGFYEPKVPTPPILYGSSFIGGGQSNRIKSLGVFNNIVGGYNNSTTGGTYSNIIGGKNNVIKNSYGSTIGGGYNSYIINTMASNILGGYSNFITAQGWTGSIVGGYNNRISGGTSFGDFIGAGGSNYITSAYSVIGGGLNNRINNNYSSIIGGQQNIINHNNTHIIGSNITSFATNTTHVENLNIGKFDFSAGIYPLYISADNMVVTGDTGLVSGSCLNDFYVSNIHSCSPLYVNPLDEGNIHFGLNSGITFDLTFTGGTRVGINKSDPGYALQLGNGDLFVTEGTLGVGESPDPTQRVRITTSSTPITVGNQTEMPTTALRIDLSHDDTTPNPYDAPFGQTTLNGIQVRSTTTKGFSGITYMYGVNSNLTGGADDGTNYFYGGQFRAATTNAGATNVINTGLIVEAINGDTNIGIRIKDGTEGTGKFLRCFDNNGNAEWSTTDEAIGYKVYRAILTQTGTTAPVATVIENSLGIDVDWGYSGVGLFSASTTASTFTLTKTLVSAVPSQFDNFVDLNKLDYPIQRVDDTTIRLGSMSGGTTLANDIMDNIPVEIKVYN